MPWALADYSRPLRMPAVATDIGVEPATHEVKTQEDLLGFFHRLGVSQNMQPAERLERGHAVSRSFNHVQRVAICQFAYGGPQTGVLYVQYALSRETVNNRVALTQP